MVLAFFLICIILLSSLISIELGISVTIIEIVMGVILGNTFHPAIPDWMNFLASIGAVLLTFLAGAEVDPKILKDKGKESLLIGIFSFVVPFVATFLFCFYVADWSLNQAIIAGISLSTTSLAVVYAVLVESGLTKTELGKIIMASCFITDLGTVLALTLVFSQYSIKSVLFLAGSIVIIGTLPWLLNKIRQKYGEKLVQPDLKLILVALFAIMVLAEIGQGQSVLPAFILGLFLSKTFSNQPEIPAKLRTIAFAILTTFFFLKAGMNVSVTSLTSQLILLGALFLVKIASKSIGVYPLAHKYVPANSMFTTLLMSTGLTFGTISAMFGLNNGYIDKSQFSLLVTVVVASAIIPTLIAQKWFQPDFIVYDNEEDAGTESLLSEEVV
jgi:Kef-type K+ transport system membrane component KefB